MPFYRRVVFFYFLVVLIGFIYAAKLFSIQVFVRKYSDDAKNNCVRGFITMPYRGAIVDRNENVLVENVPVYDLLIPRQDFNKYKEDDLCKDLDLDEENIKNFKKTASQSIKTKPQLLKKNISQVVWSKLQERLYKYPSISVKVKTVRKYRHKVLSQTLGYIAEISSKQLDEFKDGDNNYNYIIGDMIGISGIEGYYEKFLRGRKGVEYKITDVYGLVQNRFNEGESDIAPVAGSELKLTVDLTLQLYLERLMENKVGSIIAIDPKTGEILAIVSSPTYDPNMLTGAEMSKNFKVLMSDKSFPLFNRPIMATYPPGSIFKVVQALIGLHLKAIDFYSSFDCDKKFINCHSHPPKQDLAGAIKHSCNPYFGYVFKRILSRNREGLNKFELVRVGLEEWLKEIKKFGLGERLGIDIIGEKRGFIPNVKFYDRLHGHKNWKHSTIRSLDIGQGEILITPLQMLNIATVIANRGFFVRPHIVKSIGGEDISYSESVVYVDYEKEFFSFVADSMEEAVKSGTAKRAGVPGLSVCAKTGTVQNPHGDDHSVTFAFAPKEDPKIVVCVFIENGGWGGRAGSAIAGLAIEMYIKKHISRKPMEDYVLLGKFIL